MSGEIATVVRNHIAKGELKEAISMLRNTPPYSYDNTLISISHRYNFMARQYRSGEVNNREFLEVSSSIGSHLLEFLDLLEENNKEHSLKERVRIVNWNLEELTQELNRKRKQKEEIEEEINYLRGVVVEMGNNLMRIQAQYTVPQTTQFNVRFVDKNSSIIDNSSYILVGAQLFSGLNELVRKHILLSMIILVVIGYWVSKNV